MVLLKYRKITKKSQAGNFGGSGVEPHALETAKDMRWNYTVF
jgi:hypothetical protein